MGNSQPVLPHKVVVIYKMGQPPPHTHIYKTLKFRTEKYHLTLYHLQIEDINRHGVPNHPEWLEFIRIIA